MTMKRTKLQEHLQNNVFQRFPMRIASSTFRGRSKSNHGTKGIVL